MGNAYFLIPKSCVLGLLLVGLACAHIPRTSSRLDQVAFRGAVLAGTERRASSSTRINGRYGQLPLSFEANTGQMDRQVDFISRGKGYALFLTAHEAVFVLRAGGVPATTDGQSSATPTASVLKMQLIGASAMSKAAGVEQLPGTVNYFIGNDPKGWRSNIPTYAKVTYSDVYPGVDLIYYGNQRQLEYDFIVAPGGDPGRIGMSFEGARAVEIDGNGDLVLQLAGGEVRLRKPLAHQQVDGSKRIIPAAFALQTAGGTQKVGFNLGGYDSSRPLVIDPVVVYSTYLGGGGSDLGAAIAFDSKGAAYAVGATDSPDFPTTPAAFDTSANGSFEVFVTKLNSTGSALEYSTYLGGSVTPEFWDRPRDLGASIAVDHTGAAYVTGGTSSSDFPTTPGAFDRSYNRRHDAFVTKLDPTGSALVYSTYLGGISSDSGKGIGIDESGSAYVVGATDSWDFPTTPGAFGTTPNGVEGFDAFVTKLDATGSTLMYSTYLSGGRNDSASSIAVDPAGNAYVTGNTQSFNFPTTASAFDSTYNGLLDVFVTALNASGSALVYSTFLGGSHDDQAGAIALDGEGAAYVTGMTGSSEFPTTAGAFDNSVEGPDVPWRADVFVTKLNTSGSALEYSTYLGGTDSEGGFGIAVDAADSAHVTGSTRSDDFPTTPDAHDTTVGFEDAFVTQLNATGSSLVYSTYLGGSAIDHGRDIALDPRGSAYVIGQTRSADFPATAGAFDTTYNGLEDTFVAKFAVVPVPATLTLSPPAATNPVGSEHCVTATVSDAAGNPVPDVIVRFIVAGAVNTSGSATTNANGQAVFCYMGPALLPGGDAITAYADADNDNVQDVGEPAGAAAKTWVLPATAGTCTVTVGGHMTAANGDRGTFGGQAHSKDDEAQGNLQYQDHGPAQPMKVRSINVRAVVCDGPTQASIFGEADVNGSGAVSYRITVKDLGEPGKGRDTYWILLSNGYSSGEQTLEGGNVQIRRE